MIDVIIPFFNRPEYTKVLLDSLYSTDHGAQIRPVIVDNGSRRTSKDIVIEWRAAYAGLAEDVKKQVAEPKCYELDSNKGFAGAVNAALTEPPSGEFVVIMHNDCVPMAGWAGEMLACFEQADEETAVLIPRTNYANEHGPCIPDLRTKFEAIKPPNKNRLTPEQVLEVVNSFYPDKKALVQSLKETKFRTIYCPEIASFCMMTRSSTIAKYGKFCEDFWPRGWEDKFWFRPLERDGYVCMVACHAFVHHFGNITSDGPGFSFPDSMKLNEERYKAKCLELDKKPMAAPPVKASV